MVGLEDWVLIPALLMLSCVTVGKSFNLCELLFSGNPLRNHSLRFYLVRGPGLGHRAQKLRAQVLEPDRPEVTFQHITFLIVWPWDSHVLSLI